MGLTYPFWPRINRPTNLMIRRLSKTSKAVALNDGSKPASPEEALKKLNLQTGSPCRWPPMNRLWPNRSTCILMNGPLCDAVSPIPVPRRLEIVEYDKYLRAVYDKAPPPPNHFRGKDKITIHEDTDGDGVFDKHKTFLDGLNMARSDHRPRRCMGIDAAVPAVLSRQKRRRHSDGDPRYTSRGSAQKTPIPVPTACAGARWLDLRCTWQHLYRGDSGHQVSRAVWRYHPRTKKFEVFGEGGGNTFCIDFDSQGRLFSGTNHGNTRGVHYPQGSSFTKNWGKHGPLINPYAFGYYQHMAHEGYKPRFAQSTIIYEGGALPGYEGNIISGMTRCKPAAYPDTSTFRTVDTPPMVTTEDRWLD